MHIKKEDANPAIIWGQTEFPQPKDSVLSFKYNNIFGVALHKYKV